jgi:hypothetical protein
MREAKINIWGKWRNTGKKIRTVRRTEPAENKDKLKIEEESIKEARILNEKRRETLLTKKKTKQEEKPIT